MPLMHPLLAGDERLERAAAGGPSIKPLPVVEPRETVRRIQLALCELSYVFFDSFADGLPDGLFGPDTRRAVIHFQRAEFMGRPDQWDGRVGRNTLAKLDAALAYSKIKTEFDIFSRVELKPLRGPAKVPAPKPKPSPSPKVQGNKRIEVNTDTQSLHAFLGERRVYYFDCVTGDSDHPTDPGTHTIFRKQHPCRSTTYNVQMNYAQFFTIDGKAIHQYHGLLPLAAVRLAKKGSDWFGSHGCVRLTEDDAKALFLWTPTSGTQAKVVPFKKK